MSFGKLFISAVVKNGNRNYLNRVKDELFHNKAIGGDTVSETEMLAYVNRHILQYRTMPTPDVLRAAGMPYIETDQPPEYYITELKKRAVYNAFKRFTTDITPVVTQNFDLDRAYDLINRFSSEVSTVNTSDRFRSILELGTDIQTEIEGRKNGTPDVFIPFGWPTLDALTGGAQGGDLVYNVARPGKGKTNTLVYNSHHAWQQGFKPLLVTNEMTDIQIARRLYGLQGQFNPDAIRRGIPDNEVERRLGSARTTFEGGHPFYIVSGNTKQTVDSITSLVDELQPDVVYIDAAYLLKMNGPAKILWEKIAAIGEELKHLAISRNIPIIQTVQFNRDAAKSNKFNLETIAGSDAISQLGSIILATNEAEEPYSETRRTISIIKNREGGVCDFDINYRFDPPDFTELSALRDTNLEEAIRI